MSRNVLLCGMCSSTYTVEPLCEELHTEWALDRNDVILRVFLLSPRASTTSTPPPPAIHTFPILRPERISTITPSPGFFCIQRKFLLLLLPFKSTTYYIHCTCFSKENTANEINFIKRTTTYVIHTYLRTEESQMYISWWWSLDLLRLDQGFCFNHLANPRS